jgi:SAM-dependent methyltransferase
MSTNSRILRGILHPVRAGRYLAERARLAMAESQLRRDAAKVRRGTRERCWCGGDLRGFDSHPSYKICAACGTFVNIRPPLQESLAEIYSVQSYWRQRQKLKGHPTIEERAARYRADGRLDRWLELMKRYGPASGTVIEVGCAPGVLLQELAARGYQCVGVEINPDVAQWMRETTKLDVRSGFYPGGVELPPCDLFLSFDVIEHSPCPDEFLREAARLLRPGGAAVIQTAIERYNFTPPFGERFDMFDDVEHLFLFTDLAMGKLAEAAGLQVVSLQERLWLAGEVAVFRKPGQA